MSNQSQAPLIENRLESIQQQQARHSKQFAGGGHHFGRADVRMMLDAIDDLLSLLQQPTTSERCGEQCQVTCADFPLSDCKEAHQCVLDKGHPFDPMYGEIHRFVTHQTSVQPRSMAASGTGNGEQTWATVKSTCRFCGREVEHVCTAFLKATPAAKVAKGEPRTIEERGALAIDHRDMEWVLEAPDGLAPITAPAAPQDESVRVQEFATANQFLDAYQAAAIANEIMEQIKKGYGTGYQFTSKCEEDIAAIISKHIPDAGEVERLKDELWRFKMDQLEASESIRDIQQIPCPDCDDPIGLHAIDSRIVGCQAGDGTEDNPICGCRTLYGEAIQRVARASAIREAVDTVRSLRSNWDRCVEINPRLRGLVLEALDEVTAALQSLLDKKEGER